jgi:kynureninase
MAHTVPTLEDCRTLDAADPLARLAGLFDIPPGLIYLDGNSLGPLPKAASAAVGRAVQQEWGQGLIRSWNDAGWITRAQAVGNAIAPLVGAGAGELLVADSTSLNLHKVLWAALSLATVSDRTGRAKRRVLLTERINFPTDRYIAQGVCEALGWTLRDAPAEALPEALDAPDVGVLMLTHVNYRSGAVHDMAALNAHCAQAGVLTVWDLAHSAGAVPVDLKGSGADFAVGCGYKFLNGGPGAPAFVWVHPRHVDAVEQPLRGWLGHAAPFAFEQDYRPAAGIARYVCGTPPILSLTALQAGVDTLRAADALGGMAALRAKSLSLTRTFIAAAEPAAQAHGLWLLSPRDDVQRGSQVSWACPPGRDGQALDGYAVMRALIARGIIGDFRAGDGTVQAPDILRFGFAPLYNTHEQAWRAAQALGEELQRVATAPLEGASRPAVT